MLKVYIYPLLKRKEAEVTFTKYGPDHKLITISYIFSIIFAVVALPFLFDSYQKIKQIEDKTYTVTSGEIIELVESTARRNYFFLLKDVNGSIKKIQYKTDVRTIKTLINKMVKVDYVNGWMGDAEMVGLSVDGNLIRSISKDINLRYSRLQVLLKIESVLILLVLVLPWIRYRKYGLLKSNE